MAADRRQALAQAYAATTYRVLCAAPVDVRIGLPSTRLDAVLCRHGVRSWAFVTAWNPASRRLAPWRNRSRQRRLLRLLHKLGYRSLPGVAIADSGGWPPEESVIVLGIAPHAALRIARCFAQNAIVAGRRRGPARLLWT